MCGFAGTLSHQHPATEAELRQMGAAIAHRGPDSDGVWLDNNAGVYLVHRRLAVVDISETGHQPMHSSSGRYVLCFNGEIYNHKDIRSTIDKRNGNISWRGTSDTETLLESIEQVGLASAIQDWVGMFSFALWDSQLRTLTLGRDRFGEKPLYYGTHGKRILFASELKALKASERFSPEIDPDALALYFRHHYVPAPHTIFTGIKKLPAGTLATFSTEPTTLETQEPTLTHYWHAPSVANTQFNQPFKGNLTQATDEVQRLFAASIKDQCIADVPVGAFLSGGIDSSAVVGLMQANRSSPVKTFSVGFEEDAFNEANHAKKVAEYFQTDHTELYLSGDDAQALLPNLAAMYDEPFADASQIPTYAVSKLAREHVTVSLSGDGGDELFGGYTRYGKADKALKMRQKLGKLGNHSARLLAHSPLVSCSINGQLSPASFLPQRFGSLPRAIQLLAQPTDAHTYQDMLSFWHGNATPALASSNELTTEFLTPSSWQAQRGNKAAVQMIDTLTYLPDEILVKVDRAAMQVSLETRVPLLDHRLAEFVWTLPTELVASTTRPKQILFDIACRMLPTELLDRPKMGFGVPLATWLRGPLRDWAEALIDTELLQQQNLLSSTTVTSTWSQFLQGDDSLTDPMWGILSFQAWYVEHLAT